MQGVLARRAKVYELVFTHCRLLDRNLLSHVVGQARVSAVVLDIPLRASIPHLQRYCATNQCLFTLCQFGLIKQGTQQI